MVAAANLMLAHLAPHAGLSPWQAGWNDGHDCVGSYANLFKGAERAAYEAGYAAGHEALVAGWKEAA